MVVLALLTLLALGGAMMLFSARPAAANIAPTLAGCDQVECFLSNQTDCEASAGTWTASTTTCILTNVEFPCGQTWYIEVNLVAEGLTVQGCPGNSDQFNVFLGWSMTIPFNENVTNNGVFTNDASVTNDGDFYNLGTLNNQGTITNAKGTVVVLGTTVSFTGAIKNSGTFINDNGLGVPGTFTNQGLFMNSYNGVAGAFDNPLGSVFTNTGTFTNPVGASITNTDGTITNQAGGTFDTGGSITNSEDGTITNDAGATFNFGTTTNTAHINNYGTLDIFLDTFNNNLGGGITNENGATTTVSDTATLNNNGVFANDAGATLTIAAGASFDNTVELDNYGAIANSGTTSNTGGEGVIYDYCGSTFTNTGTLTGNAIVGSCGSTTTLSSSLNPSNFGQLVTFIATVSPTPTTGDLVTLYENGVSIGTGHTNGGGQVTISTSPSSVGSSSFWATFAGDVLYGSSVSNTVTQTVNPLLSYSGPAGSSATLTPSSGGYVATITGSGGSSLGQVTLPSGTTIPTGTVTVTYAASGSNSLLQVGGATIPYPPGKTMTLLNSVGATSVCIVDSAQSPTSLQAGTCGTSSLINSEAILQCNGEAYTYPGFATQTSSQTWPSGTPQSRTFTCTATTQNGLNYLQVSGLAYGTTIIDGTPPVLTLPSNILTHTAPAASTAVIDFTVTASDSLDPFPVVSCSPSSGSTFPIGITTVNCTATDAAGNVATGSFLVTVIPLATPTITTTLSATSIIPAESFTDSATLQGATSNAGGSVIYTLYFNSGCTGFGDNLEFYDVTNGNVPSLTGETGTDLGGDGSYGLVATYSGDSSNEGATSACEPLTVGQAAGDSIFAAVSPPGSTMGSSLTMTDTATLSGGYSPTGGIVFFVYYWPAGSTPGCDFNTDNDHLVYDTQVLVNGNGQYSGSPFTPTEGPGDYYWIAEYGGDSNNAGVSTTCGAEFQTFVVQPATPFILTILTADNPTNRGTITLGGSSSDTATFQGGYQVTGSLVFSAYASTSCTGTPAFTSSAITVNGDGPYTSSSFTPYSAGTYSWQATYSGDANNNGATSACGGPGETLTVVPLSLTLTPQSGGPGTVITLSGSGFVPSSTYLYCYEPNYDSSPTACPSGSPTFMTDASGNIPTSPAPTVTASGTSNGAVIITVPVADTIPIGVQFDLIPLTSTSLSVSCSPSPIAIESEATCTGTVSGVAPGAITGETLTFSEVGGAASLSSGSCVLVGDSCSVNAVGASVGSVAISTTYAGDTTYSSSTGSTSLPVTQETLTISPQTGPSGTIITLSGGSYSPSSTYIYCYEPNYNSNPTACAAGSPAFTTDASGNIPTSPAPTVTASGTSNGAVIITDSVTGRFPIGVQFDLSTPTTTTISCATTSFYAGSPNGDECTATVTGANPSGSVRWTSTGGSFSSQVCDLTSVGLKMECLVTFLEGDPDTPIITATYSGDAVNLDSSGTIEVTVLPSPTSTSVSCVPSSVVVATSTTCIAVVSDNVAVVVGPAGEVIFTDHLGRLPPTPCNLIPVAGTPGQAACSIQFTPSSGQEGANVLIATYTGDVQHQGSASQFTVTATQRADTVSVTCAPSPVPVTSTTTCTALVTDTSPGTPIPPTGAVLFNRATSTNPPVACSLIPVSISAAEASCSIQIPTALGQEGSYAILAGYNGDVDHVTSSTQFTVTVTKASSSVAVSCSPNPVTLASTTTCTALVSGVSVTGPMAFSSTSSTGVFTPSSGTCTLTAGSCSVSYSDTTVGAIAIAATYSGDSNNFGSSSTTSLTESYKSCPQVTSNGGQNLKGANLEYCDLGGYNLSGDNLQGANLQNTNLQGANLKGANLQSANLANSNAAGANFQGANLQSAVLSNTILTGDNFQGVNLQGANLAGDSASGANFQGANLQTANLSGGDFDHVNFQGANLHNSNMSNGDFDYANFQGANTQGANIAGATFTGATNPP